MLPRRQRTMILRLPQSWAVLPIQILSTLLKLMYKLVIPTQLAILILFAMDLPSHKATSPSGTNIRRQPRASSLRIQSELILVATLPLLMILISLYGLEPRLAISLWLLVMIVSSLLKTHR